MHAPIAVLLRIWGHGTPATVRFRLYFAAHLPGLLLGVASTIAIPFFSAPVFESVLVPALGLTVLAYGVTVFRGLPTGQRGWRGAAFGAFALCADLLVTFSTFVIGFAWLYGSGPA